MFIAPIHAVWDLGADVNVVDVERVVNMLR